MESTCRRKREIYRVCFQIKNFQFVPAGTRSLFSRLKTMEKQDLRIIYMGTPDFAVESLKRLVEGGYNVVAVITMPDKPAGRGHKIQYSPVNRPVERVTRRPANRRSVSHASRNRSEHATSGYFQFTCFAFTSIQRSRSSQLGYYQRRHRNRNHDILPQTRNRYGRNHTATKKTYTSRRKCKNIF